jgi:hypothetical protein
MRIAPPPAVLALVALTLASCSTFGAVYPPRPPATPGAPTADPSPSRVVAHVSVAGSALRATIDAAVPKSGEGAFTLLRTRRKYTWDRTPFEVSFSQGRIVLVTKAHANVDMPVGSLDFPLEIRVVAEPVVSAEYQVKLQSTEVKVTSTDRRLVVADHVAGVFDTIAKELDGQVKGFAYDLRPALAEAYARISKPIELPVGDARGCATVKVLGIEAGPTIIADGLEKDIALVVAPEVTMPCATAVATGPLPAFANVAMVPPGPFTVTVPIAARYDELARAMGVLFTDGKYFFSAEFPKLYLENPEVYDSQGQIVLKVHLKGPVKKLGIETDLDGDIYFSGHLAIADNEIQVPDLEPTIETSNLLLSLKAMADGKKIRDQARTALRLDLGERLRGVREKLSTDLTFRTPSACFQGAVDKLELTSAHTHGSYLRAYVAVTARASAQMPCPAVGSP